MRWVWMGAGALLFYVVSILAFGLLRWSVNAVACDSGMRFVVMGCRSQVAEVSAVDGIGRLPSNGHGVRRPYHRGTRADGVDGVGSGVLRPRSGAAILSMVRSVGLAGLQHRRRPIVVGTSPRPWGRGGGRSAAGRFAPGPLTPTLSPCGGEGEGTPFPPLPLAGEGWSKVG